MKVVLKHRKLQVKRIEIMLSESPSLTYVVS
jgi:hypothetical protein